MVQTILIWDQTSRVWKEPDKQIYIINICNAGVWMCYIVFSEFTVDWAAQSLV